MSPSFTASKVPGGAEGCFGSICSLTRPLLAFSTFCAQTAKTSFVSECDGGTQLDIVRVVCAATVMGQPPNAIRLKAAMACPRKPVVPRMFRPPTLPALNGHQLTGSVKVFCGSEPEGPGWPLFLRPWRDPGVRRRTKAGWPHQF